MANNRSRYTEPPPIPVDDDSGLKEAIEQLHGRCQRLELVCETLVELLVEKEVASEEEIRVLMQQIDLRDGHEDQADRKREDESAPTCGECGNYVNPERNRCVYCNAPVEVAEKSASPPPETVTCAACGQEVDKRETYFTENGTTCSGCYSGY